MNIRTIPDSLPGEHLLSVVPKPSPNLELPWHRRLNLFTGRSLSDFALQAEQRSRAGHLALLGGSLSPGIVQGLPVTVEVDATGQSDWLHVGGGSGITAQGEEIVLSQALRVNFTALRQPENTQMRVQILLLQPISVLTRNAERGDCEDDDTNLAFEDRQQVDGVRLRLYDWDAKILPEGTDAASLSRWRSQLAYTLFNEELKQNELGQRMPWETLGLPIALMGLDATLGKILFADRDAVVRKGGKPRTRSPLVFNSGNEFIWQARVQQFTEQFATTSFEGVTQSAISQYFYALPPVGLLPANAVDWVAQQSLIFPANYTLRARVLPLEELDKVMEASASLMPFLLNRPEQVEVIVPVPQAFYEPDVLKQETVDPIFAQTRQRLLQHRAEWLGRRNWNRDRLALLTSSLTGKTPEFEADDPNEAKPDPLTSFEPLLAEPNYDTTGSGQTLEATVLKQLRADLRNQTPLDQDAVVVTSWTTAITILGDLSKKVSFSSGNKLLRVNGVLSVEERNALQLLSPSDSKAIEDLFQQSQDNNELDQLNPKLPDDSKDNPNFKGIANFMQLLQSKVAQADDAIEFNFLQVRTDMYRVRQFVLGTEEASLLATSPTLAEIVKRNNSAVATQRDLQQFFQQSRQKVVKEDSQTPPVIPSKPTSQSTDQLAFLSAPNFDVVSPIGTDAATSLNISRAAPLISNRSIDFLPVADVASPIAASAVFRREITPDDVIAQAPIIGQAQQSVAVGDRLTEAPAIQARNYTVANRKSTLTSLANVGIFKDVMIPGQDFSFGQIGQGQNVISEIKPPAISDEFTYISSGVKALDNTVAALRLAEGRTQAYRLAIALCQTAITKLQGTVQQISQRLQVIEGELTEIRHDLSVTQALENEETTRINAINARRKKILNEQVPFLAFHRPRVAQLLVNSPTIYVNPAAAADPVPACLNAHPGVPEDLRAMIDLLRHAPVGWFVALSPVVDQLNTLDLLYRTFDASQQRGIIPILPQTTAAKGLGLSISLAVQSNRQVLLQKRQEWINSPSLWRPPTWQAGRDQANAILTLGDLIDGNHGRSLVSRQATRLLDQMAQVAACLYDRFNDVLPQIRLGWAQQLSEFDSPVNLRSLASLPRWSEIPVLDRRDLQTLADWLYQQMQTAEPAAIAFLNDLIRVSILLASHAPVRQIINGSVTKPIPARPGNRIELTVDHTQINVGMTVLLHSDSHEVIAQAIVEDLSRGQATAKITQLLKPDLQQIPINTRARFLTQPY